MKEIKIATIYNDVEELSIEVYYNTESKEINYHVEDGRIVNADETAETIQQAIDDTYARYCYDWDLKLEEVTE